jgi:tetratricopeptide (TPR) repeat protein
MGGLVICESCQAPIEDLPFCPYCGHRQSGQAAPAAGDHTLSDKAIRCAQRKRLLQRLAVPTLLLVVIIVFGVLGLALSGLRDGIQERNRSVQHQAEVRYNRGLIYLEWGQYQMAEAEFEEAVRLVPGYADAEAKWRVAELKQTVTPTPAPSPTPTPTATPVRPTPTPERVIVPVAQVLFEQAQAYYQKQQWEDAISSLEQLLDEDANYQSDQVVEMLFLSHKNYGVSLEAEDMLEEAISHYDSALYLRRRDPEVEEFRQRADLYLRALGFWNADWSRVVVNLTALNALSPDYKDTAERLYQACTIQGQALIKQERYCAAAELYQQALKVHADDPEVVKLQDDTSHLCRVRGPDPVETPAPGATLTTTIHIGTLVGTCYDHRTNEYSVCAQNAEDNVLQTWITQAEQPALSLDGRALAYRSSDPANPGLYAVVLTPSVSIGGAVVPSALYTITTEARVASPTWSPDGSRLAYALYDPDAQAWYIYIAWIGSKDSPRRIHQGEWPSWGPNGLLAFTTCSAKDSCGIHVLDLSSWKLRKLTDSIQDRAPAWSPSGDEIAYMSDIGRSFNVYVAQIQPQMVTVRQLQRDLFKDGMPVWSPDGQRIAFVTNRDDDWSVYTLHPSLGEDHRRVVAMGAESADWLRLQLAWVAPVVRFSTGQ